MYMHVVNNCYSPKETVELCSRAGVMKANMRLDKVFFSAVMAGCLLAFACAAVLITETAPWYQENAPGFVFSLPFGCWILERLTESCIRRYVDSSG